MRKYRWQIELAILLILLSFILYVIHYSIFGDAHHIFIYLLGDIAFMPIEVLVISLVVHRALTLREQRAKMEKLNMVIGMFFSELGTDFLSFLSDSDPHADEIRKDLQVRDDWSSAQFKSMTTRLQCYEHSVDVARLDLEKLRHILADKRDLLLRLIENPQLLEHDTFTDLLWAVFHLAEELNHRSRIADLPESDLKHIERDIRRAYSAVSCQWLAYMRHLKDNYPYLFSLAIRTNPFDKSASPVVT